MASARETGFGLFLSAVFVACSATDEVVVVPDPVGDAGAQGPRDSGLASDRNGVDAVASVDANGAMDGRTTVGRDTCGNGLDDDGNGMVDDGCPCLPGTSQPCYPRNAAEVGRGPCMRGTQGCEGEGEFGRWTECVGAVTPTEDTCGDGVDQDCSGTPDDNPMCRCRPGATEPCYTGPMGTQGVGICRPGMRACAPDGRSWGTCLDEVLPRAEICSNRVDDDCDGAVDNGPMCACTANMMRECYPGPRTEAGVGICRAGMQTCNAGGTAWGACTGAVGPMTEVCGNMLDDDCDGMPDDGCPAMRVCMVTVNLNGDCVTVRCPADCPYPVGCSITMAGDDPRGCVASRPDNPVVYFQEGDVCGAGRVTGTLSCSNIRGAGLNATTCRINKPRPTYPTDRTGCPR